MTTPFVDYYRSLGISPVRQDIANIERHHARRRTLYRRLGIIPRFVRDRRVIELCAGSGYNALYTGSLRPQHYLLVDANPHGLAEAEALFAAHVPPGGGTTFALAYVADVPTDAFDLVICEGAIPFQREPKIFARGLLRFAAPGAAVIVTTIDSMSFLSEVLRRVVADRVSAPDLPVPTRLEQLRPFFAPHLATLRDASRPLDDWILDNILNPFEGQFFSVLDAIEVFDASGFILQGASPRFVDRDWRWYKNPDAADDVNTRARTSYLRTVANLIDVRAEVGEHDETMGSALLRRGDRLFSEAQQLRAGDGSAAPRVSAEIAALVPLLHRVAPTTAAALLEAGEIIADPRRAFAEEAAHFAAWFGRGQQHLCFLAPE